MSTPIARTLRKARNLFRKLGVQPPFWLIRLGRRLHDRSMAAAPAGAHISNDPQPLVRLEAKIDHLIWQNERIEATLYLQSLQAPAVSPLSVAPAAASAAAPAPKAPETGPAS